MLAIRTDGAVAPALLTLGFVLLPGMALSVALFGPGRLSLTTRMALLLPMGFAGIAAISTLLALLHVLTLAALVVAYALVLVGLVVVAALRSGLARQPAALREDLAADPWGAALALAVLAGLFVAHLFVPTVLNLGGYTPLRYWSDGLEVAAAHRIPELAVQWGRTLPSGTSKMALNAANAAFSLVLGHGPLVPMAAAGAVMAAAVGMSLVALGRELGLRLTAPLLAVLVVANLRLGNPGPTMDRNFYLGENWGRAVAFAAAALAIRALRSRRGEHRILEAVTAGALLGLASMVHLVPTAVAVLLVVLYAVIRAIVDRRPAERARGAVLVLGVGISLGAVLMFVAPGDSGFQGPGDPGVYAKLDRQLGLPPTFDPTLYLARGFIDQAPRPATGSFYRPPSETVRKFAGSMVGAPDPGASPWIPISVAAVALGVVVVAGTSEVAIATGAAVALGVGLLLVALAFSYEYRVYALALFGERRLFDYTALVEWLVVLGVVETGLLWLGPSPPGLLWRRGTPREPARRPAWLPGATAALVFVVAVAWLVPNSVRWGGLGLQQRRLTSMVPALDWIEHNVPCDGRVLADRRTLGAFEAATGRVGVLEGAGPYFRIDVLRVAIGSVLDARRFLRDPRGMRGYLARNHVAAVVLTRAGGGPLGAFPIRPVATGAFAEAPFLRKVVKTPAATVYRVTTFDGGPAPPPGSPFCTGRD